MSDAPVLMWFRRDLRVQDNLALAAALESGRPVLPLFIFDERILRSPNTRSPRLKFLLNALNALDQSFKAYGTRLQVLHGDPLPALNDLVTRFGATALYFNRDYTPFARHRDQAIQEALSISVHSFDDAVLHAPGDVLKADGEPYVVFTPFKRAWLKLNRSEARATFLENATVVDPGNTLTTVPSLDDLGFDNTFELPVATEAAAHRHLQAFMANNIFHYNQARNRLVATPWKDTAPGSSYLSPYLRLGLLSPRQVYWAAREAYLRANDAASRESVETYVGELVWRDFYMHIMYFFPHVATGSFRPQYDHMEWLQDAAALQAWKDGMTGYPIVDAAMRQLKAIGWMPNRARMIVASFLTKDLLIDWRAGEQHFMQWLIDGDPAANNGGWQWAAGTGTDAQPYFRIFNPVSQSKKFDADGTYIRYWVPELSDVPNKYIHAPWEMNRPPQNYPAPIVDHKFARERTLQAYKAVKESI